MSLTKSRKIKQRGKAMDRCGFDGLTIVERPIKTGVASQHLSHKVRVRTGSFEWRYGRVPNAKYHAGATFARIWERAGIASACAATLDGTAGGGGWSGVPESRLIAVDRVREINRQLGHGAVQRVVAYVVEGKIPKEIASAYPGTSDRAMASVLDVDLSDLARIMNYTK